MPYDKCVNYNGKLYCWDSKTKEINEITVKVVELDNCPKTVIKDLLSLLDGADTGENHAV